MEELGKAETSSASAGQDPRRILASSASSLQWEEQELWWRKKDSSCDLPCQAQLGKCSFESMLRNAPVDGGQQRAFSLFFVLRLGPV